ncbi:MAG: hypothetical protein QY312_03440 [Candidatus Dojkabacteria bacterium]|nr:MAG: hypothetical protein QY312_03440 [Candidatus Dojkabacteria bacterium]
MMEATLKPNKLLARSKANKLLKELSISKPPVPLNLLLRHEDLTEFPANFDALGIKNISALIEYESGMILYDLNSSYMRQRFSIAHELGQITKMYLDMLSISTNKKRRNILKK